MDVWYFEWPRFVVCRALNVLKWKSGLVSCANWDVQYVMRIRHIRILQLMFILVDCNIPIIFKIKLPSVGGSIEMSRCFAQQISPCLVPRGHFGSAASAGRVVPKDLLRLDDSISCGSWDMKQQQLGYWMLLGYFDIWNMEFRSLLLDDKR